MKKSLKSPQKGDVFILQPQKNVFYFGKVIQTDLAQAHILAVKYLAKGGESDVFNLGNGVGFTVKEVIETARKVTGHPIPAVESPRRGGDPAKLIASSEKAKKILEWKPEHASLEEIIESAWKWHKNHPNGYAK